MEITYDDFLKVDIRAGRIVEVIDFPEARIPAYKLKIDFGDKIGIKKSSAQVAGLYSKQELEGKIVVCVVNFPPKQIGPYMSEVLTLGVPNAEDKAILLSPDKEVEIGGRLY